MTDYLITDCLRVSAEAAAPVRATVLLPDGRTVHLLPTSFEKVNDVLFQFFVVGYTGEKLTGARVRLECD